MSEICPVCEDAYGHTNQRDTALGEVIIYWHCQLETHHRYCAEFCDGSSAIIDDRDPRTRKELDLIRA